MPVVVGITQRVDYIEAYGERRDALDQSWAGFAAKCGVLVTPIPNDLPDPGAFLQLLGLQGLILSGGNDFSTTGRMRELALRARLPEVEGVAPERDATELSILDAAVQQGLPVLGVCRGMQMLNLFHGGGLRRLEGHAGKPHQVELSRSCPLAAVTREIAVNSYHKLGISRDDCAPNMEVWASAGETVEAFVHRSFPHYGVMWHPERGDAREFDVSLVRRIFGTETIRASSAET